MSEVLWRPGLRFGSYPQKPESRLTDFEQGAAAFFDKIVKRLTRKRYSLTYVVEQVNRHAEPLRHCNEQQLTIAILALREALSRQGLTEVLMLRAFALIRETADRTLNKRHFDEQLFGGWLMINGLLAEMETGEGKTLTATLPACTAALAGIPVHVITANDYLAGRDADMLKPLYLRLGLKSGAVVDGMALEQRRKMYQNAIVHTTNKQIAFDYLRDRIEIGEDTGPLRFQYRQIRQDVTEQKHEALIMRGLCFAIIDEADSVLIDEAKTPLIITQTKPNDESPKTYGDALYLASSLFINDDFVIDAKSRDIELTSQGENTLADMAIGLGPNWKNKRWRETMVKQALIAEYCFKRNKQYILKDNKVQIIDEFTGRVMEDRSWEQGLQQMIEAKEGCLISEQREPLARISYQRFFGRYLKLAGTSGTVREVAAEMHRVYGLHAVKVPTHRISKRRLLSERIYTTQAAKQRMFLQRVNELHTLGRPILIGTGSVAESLEVSDWLEQAGLLHRVLNAEQDQHEAEIIAHAGQLNAITVATNMAGRGTDIALGLGVAELGGLHVIALNCNESRRIDRQLYGRCARQGDPGSCEAILSLEDAGLREFYSSAILKTLTGLANGDQALPAWLGNLILRLPQTYKERHQRSVRRQLSKQDKRLSRILAFSGKFE
ncbi:preprotein translocase subunit SecA [Methylomonas albis]|uniref:Protein translocase subunit SecA n=1 Tax=Methylomonas albis TaxID=1854563 RepID=A0ABR9D4W3_9GAMM|nr:prepilin peptidase [Methylomonas albis]MBD9357831.1 prepilin peptidase [Methylomonas albis]